MEEWATQQQPSHHRGGVDACIGEGDAGAGLMMQQQRLVIMTDDQIEILRKQIAVYTILCDKLVETHRRISCQRELADARIGNMYSDPLMLSSSHKISARLRWAPTPTQLRILENIFDQGNGTPSKQKIKEITAELSQHGQVSETNVYNWFQNRRARAKRKQTALSGNNNETEGNKELNSSKEKKEEENFQPDHIPTSMSNVDCFKTSAMSTELYSFDPTSSKAEAMFSSDDDLKPPTILGDMSFYESILSNRRVNQLTGRMEVEGDYDGYTHSDSYNLMG